MPAARFSGVRETRQAVHIIFRTDSLFEFGNPNFHLVQIALNQFEPALHKVEAAIDGFEPPVDGFESPDYFTLEIVQPPIHAIESAIPHPRCNEEPDQDR